MKRLVVCVIAVGLAGIVADTVQARWQPTLAKVEGRVRHPTSDIRIKLSGDVAMDTLQRLTLEIDGNDVTEPARLEKSVNGFVLAVSPPQPLEPGWHEVRLFEHAPGGQKLERGMWRVQIRRPRVFSETSLDVKTTIDLPYRLERNASKQRVSLGGDKLFNDGSRRKGGAGFDKVEGDDFRGNGSSQVLGRIARQDWALEGEASIQYTSLGAALTETIDDPRTGDNIDVEEYRVTRRDRVSEINLGHHAIEHDSFIMRDFQRRGVSATRTVAGGTATGTAFAMSAGAVAGHQDILGIEETDSRITGGVMSVGPSSEYLTISAAALSGRSSNDSSSSRADRDMITEGDAASVSAQTRLMDDKLRFRGEYARTDYDFDGIKGSVDEIEDDARMLLAEYNPLQEAEVHGKPTDLKLGVEYRQTGYAFRSIANAGLPADKELHRVYGRLNWGALNLSLSAGRRNDNVDAVPDSPRLNTDMVQLRGTYSPRAEYDSRGSPKTPLYGRASFSGRLRYERRKQTRIPGGFAGSRIGRRTRAAGLSADFYYPAWHWYVSHSLGLKDGFTRQGPVIRDGIADVGVNFSPGQRLYASLQYQYNRNQDQNGRVTRTRLWGAAVDVIFVPEALKGSVSYITHLDRARDDSFSADNTLVEFELDWQIVQPRRNRAGLSLWLSGGFEDLDDRTNSSDGSTLSQVLLGVSTGWPVERRH